MPVKTKLKRKPDESHATAADAESDKDTKAAASPPMSKRLRSGAKEKADSPTTAAAAANSDNKEVVHKTKKPKSKPEPECCPITLAPIVDPVLLGCGHKFEFAAIQKWTEVNPKCPICRRTVCGSLWSTFLKSLNRVHNPLPHIGPFWVPTGQFVDVFPERKSQRQVLALCSCVIRDPESKLVRHQECHHFKSALPPNINTPIKIRQFFIDQSDQTLDICSILIMDLSDIGYLDKETAGSVMLMVKYDEFVEVENRQCAWTSHQKTMSLYDLFYFSFKSIVREVLYQNRVVSFHV